LVRRCRILLCATGASGAVCGDCEPRNIEHAQALSRAGVRRAKREKLRRLVERRLQIENYHGPILVTSGRLFNLQFSMVNFQFAMSCYVAVFLFPFWRCFPIVRAGGFGLCPARYATWVGFACCSPAAPRPRPASAPRRTMTTASTCSPRGNTNRLWNASSWL